MFFSERFSGNQTTSILSLCIPLCDGFKSFCFQKLSLLPTLTSSNRGNKFFAVLQDFTFQRENKKEIPAALLPGLGDYRMAQSFWWWSHFQGISTSWQQKREFHSSVTQWEQHKAGLNCQLPTAKLPDWTPRNTPPPWGQRIPLRGRVLPPQHHCFLHTELCVHMSPENCRGQKMATGTISPFHKRNLGKTNALQSSWWSGWAKGNLASFFYSSSISLPTATYSPTPNEDKEGTFSSYLPWQLIQKKSACRQH